MLTLSRSTSGYSTKRQKPIPPSPLSSPLIPPPPSSQVRCISVFLRSAFTPPPQSRFTRFFPNRRTGARRRLGGRSEMIRPVNGGLCARRHRTEGGPGPALGSSAWFVRCTLSDCIEVHCQRGEPGQLVVVLWLRTGLGCILLWLAELVSRWLIEYTGNPIHVCKVITR